MEFVLFEMFLCFPFFYRAESTVRRFPRYLKMVNFTVLYLSLHPMSDQQQQQPSDPASKLISAIMDKWMASRDCEVVKIEGVGLLDKSFSTLTQVLTQCPSLTSVQLKNNELTMASVSEVCVLLSTCPKLKDLDLSGNQIPVRSVGYVMAALMERRAKGLGNVNKVSEKGGHIRYVYIGGSFEHRRAENSGSGCCKGPLR